MIAINKLRGCIAEKGITKAELARELGITTQTLYRKMRIGIFTSDEIYKMIEILSISNPVEIFFAKNVASNATK